MTAPTALPTLKMPRLRLRLFGPFDARLDERPLPRLRTRKEQWLLALLALRCPHAVDRVWLADALWPDSLDGALGNLRRSLNNLRTALGADGAWITSPTPGSLALEPDGCEIDVTAFDEALALGSDEALERAVALYRGPLLEGCLEEWAIPERRTRELACLKAHETLAVRAAARQEFTSSARHWRQALGIDPYEESALRGLMEALASGGGRAEALEAYRDFKRRLREETAGEPSPETQALFERLRPSTRPAGVRPAGRLPHPLTSLIGREQARRAVVSALDRSRLVTLTGIGGMGKTRLAVAVAGDCAGEDSDGAWFADLAPLSDPALVPSAVAAALGIRELGDPRDALAAFLQQKSLLLILDNCEHLRPASAALAQALLAQAPGLRVLATSRQPLGLPGETVWPVPPLSLDDTDDAPAEAARLFVERARQSGSLRSAGDVQATIADICRRLDGIPLAIELAATRARSLPLEEIAHRLADSFRLLADRRRPGPVRHQTLCAALDWSYDLLTDEEKSLLRRLSVFAGGWTLDAAQAVCAETESARERLLDVLGALVDHSLVVFEEREEGMGRYRLLETVRQYAGERLRESGEAEALQDAHLGWCRALAESAEPQLKGLEQAAWLDRLEADHDNLRAALAWGGGRDPEAALRLASDLARFWVFRGHASEGRAALTVAAAAAPPAVRLRALHEAGALASAQGDYAAARDLLERSLDGSRDAGDRAGEAAALGRLGEVLMNSGDHVTAQTYLEAALGLNARLGESGSEAENLGALGYVARVRGDFAAACSFLGRAIRIYEEHGDVLLAAANRGSLAFALLDQGDTAGAGVLLQRTLADYRRLGNRPGQAWALASLAGIERDQGEIAAAVSRLEEALAINREVGNRAGEAWNLNSLGAIWGEGDAARQAFTQALAICRDIGDRPGVAENAESLGTLALSEGRLAEARAFYTQSLTVARQIQPRNAFTRAVEACAALALAEGAPQDAARLLGAAQAAGPPERQESHERTLAGVRAALGGNHFAEAWEEGRTLTLDETVGVVLAGENRAEARGTMAPRGVF